MASRRSEKRAKRERGAIYKMNMRLVHRQKKSENKEEGSFPSSQPEQVTREWANRRIELCAIATNSSINQKRKDSQKKKHIP